MFIIYPWFEKLLFSIINMRYAWHKPYTRYPKISFHRRIFIEKASAEKIQYMIYMYYELSCVTV